MMLRISLGGGRSDIKKRDGVPIGESNDNKVEITLLIRPTLGG